MLSRSQRKRGIIITTAKDGNPTPKPRAHFSASLRRAHCGLRTYYTMPRSLTFRPCYDLPLSCLRSNCPVLILSLMMSASEPEKSATVPEYSSPSGNKTEKRIAIKAHNPFCVTIMVRGKRGRACNYARFPKWILVMMITKRFVASRGRSGRKKERKWCLIA